MTAPSASALVDGLQHVLAAQHACVFGYPALGTHLTDDGQISQARSQEDAHRLVRDAVSAQLVALGQTPAASDTGYSPPAALTSSQAAQQWAVQLEEDVAAAYRYLLVCAVQAASPASMRTQAIAGLTTAASAAVAWRRLVTPDAPTVAFPGTP